MSKRNFYAAVSVTENGKSYANVWRFSESENIAATLSRHRFDFVALCPTKKKAAEIAKLWDDSYKANGTYMFEGGPF